MMGVIHGFRVAPNNAVVAAPIVNSDGASFGLRIKTGAESNDGDVLLRLCFDMSKQGGV